MRRDKTYTGLLCKKACRRYVKKLVEGKKEGNFMCVKQISPYAAFRPSWTRQRGIGAGTCSLFANAPHATDCTPRFDTIFDSKSGRAFPSLSAFSAFRRPRFHFQRVSPFHSLQSSASRLFTFIKS